MFSGKAKRKLTFTLLCCFIAVLLASCSIAAPSKPQATAETSAIITKEVTEYPTKVVELVTSTPTVQPQKQTAAPVFSAVSYSGAGLKAGSFVFVSVREKEKESDFYQVMPEKPFKPELIATVKGLAYHFNIHPDLKGFDYATGERQGESDPLYHQLFSYRFSDPQSKLVLNFENDAYDLSWSFDGQYLAIIQAKDTSSPNLARSLSILDLSCEKNSDCAPQPVQNPWNLDPYRAVWSPAGPDIAFVGQTPNQYGTRDVFIVRVDQHGQVSNPKNLTNTDTVEELSPQWLPDGKGLIFACSVDSSPNEYTLCGSDAAQGNPKELQRLPFNMKDFTLSPQGESLYDYFYGEQSPALRTIKIGQQEPKILIENVEAEHYPLIVISADEKNLGFIEKGGRQVIILDLASHQKENISIPGSGYTAWLQWLGGSK